MVEQQTQLHVKTNNPINDWSQFLFDSWRNNLNQVVHTGLRKVISNEPNK